MLAVTDTGTGMSDETKSRIFEPFFTTKTRDKGTGLGLSTVYGIVSQSGGYLWVYSELEHGTTFKVYLPRVDQKEARERPRDLAPRMVGGTERVLLVEDEEAVRFLARVILERAGYNVLDASNPREAEEIFNRVGEVDILVTDVIMPGGTGTDLFQTLGKRASSLRVLFMSGYTGDAVIDQGTIGQGAAFLEKPFTAAGLVAKVREVLDR
jgi:CheY-like chemotaxis protein